MRVGADLRLSETQLWLFRSRARAAVLQAEEAVASEGGTGTAQAGRGGTADREAFVRAAVDLGR